MNGSSNPKTAVALKYRAGTDRAPQITAKGRGRTAEKIITLAREHGIYVHPDPDLAAVLAQLDLEAEIPPELYGVVAELLAFVYRLNQKQADG